MLEGTRPADDRVENFIADKRCSHRLISGSQALADSQDVRCNLVLFACKEVTRAAQAAHDFVEDQQYTVFVADLPNLLEVFPDWRNGSGRRANNGSRNECSYGVLSKLLDLGIKLVSEALREKWGSGAVPHGRCCSSWPQYPFDVTLMCVRCYAVYGLSVRNLEGVMVERGIEVDHSRRSGQQNFHIVDLLQTSETNVRDQNSHASILIPA